MAQMPRVNAAALQLDFAPEGGLPLILGVKQQLSQVAANLLTNAINYTPEGRIEVTTYRENGEVCLMVQDTGMGIDEADMPHLFERFYRGQHVAQLGVPGTGLGLGIVKEIVDLHGGRVEATSEVGTGVDCFGSGWRLLRIRLALTVSFLNGRFSSPSHIHHIPISPFDFAPVSHKMGVHPTNL